MGSGQVKIEFINADIFALVCIVAKVGNRFRQVWVDEHADDREDWRKHSKDKDKVVQTIMLNVVKSED